MAIAAMSSTTHSPLAGSSKNGAITPLHVELVLSCSTLILASPPVRNLPLHPQPPSPISLGKVAPLWRDLVRCHSSSNEPYRVIPKTCLFKKEEEKLANLLLSGRMLLWLSDSHFHSSVLKKIVTLIVSVIKLPRISNMITYVKVFSR